MTLKTSTVANYVGQGFATLIGIIMLPLYLKYLGDEAYGLVGFFTLMMALFAIVDMGMTPTFSREVAIQRGKDSSDWGRLRQLLRTMEVMFAVLSVGIALAFWAGSQWIATRWLTVHSLPIGDVAYCIALMGLMAGFRLFSSLYRGGLQGLEQMVWLNQANVVIAFVRFVLMYGMLRWVTNDPRHFFEFHLAVCVVELVVMAVKFYPMVPISAAALIATFSFSSMKTVLPFASGIAFTTGVWAALTQADKLILSHALPLKEFGYIGLVSVVSNGLLNLASPLTQAILPRLTLYQAQDDQKALLDLYRKATQLMCVIMVSLVGMVAVFSTETLYAWTGDRQAADWAGPVLTWFVLGTGFLALGSFQYCMQYAHGAVRLMVMNTTVNAVLQIPLQAYAAYHYGAIGVAYTWFAFRLLNFLIWSFMVHRRFAPGLQRVWLTQDIAPSLLVTAASLLPLWLMRDQLLPSDRLPCFLALIAMGMAVLTVNVAASSVCRTWLTQYKDKLSGHFS